MNISLIDIVNRADSALPALDYKTQCFGILTCPNNGSCVGPDNCTCPGGFAPPRCDDINECLELANDCGAYKHCVNTIGSFTCECDAGLELATNDTCIDLDECLEPTTCDGYCNNSFGSYECSCDTGYTSVGASCIDDNECLVNNGGCQQLCVNEPGTFSCDCYNGYELNAGGICVDINECLMYRGGCEDVCTNLPGSFECSCRPTRTLRPDNRSCSDADSRDTVFDKYKLPRKLLPDPCYDITLTTCNGDNEVVLSSTSMWYTLHNDTNVFFTFGITFAKTENSYVPISMQGIVVTQDTDLEVVHYVLYTEEDGTTKASTMTSSHCNEYNFTSTDIFDFVTADSFIKTYFVSLVPRLPSWLKFEKSTGTIISVQDMKTKLVYGNAIDTLNDCTGAPVTLSHLYAVFTFQGDFTVDHFVKNPFNSTNIENDYCFMLDLCRSYGGAVFIMLPEEKRALIDDIRVFKTMKGNEMKLEISPYGLGFSINNGIDVDPSSELGTIWTAFQLMQDRISRVADVWIGGDIVKTDTYFVVNGSADLFLDVPDTEMMFVSFERQEWHGMIDIDTDVAPLLQFKFLNNWYEVKITTTENTIGALLSFGDPERSYCQMNGNPAGVFFKLSIAQTPFEDVPYLNKWFKSASQWYGFVAYTPKTIPTSDQHFSKEIFDVVPLISDLMDAIDSKKQAVDTHATAEVSIMLVRIKTGLSIFQDYVGDVLQQKWDDTDINGMIYMTEMLRQFYGFIDESLTEFNADVEFISNSEIESLASSFKTTKVTIKGLIGNTSLSVTDAISKEVGSYTEFGFKGTLDLVLFGLKFQSIDVELYHSGTNLFDCSKFQNIVSFKDDEKMMQFIGILTESLTLGHFLTFDQGKMRGAFALDTDKVAVQFIAGTTMLGIRYSGMVYITSSKGLYFDIQDDVWGIYEAIINVTAQVEKPWADLTYVLNGQFTTRSGTRQFQTDLNIFEEDLLDALRNYILARQSRAERALASVQSIFDRTQNLLTVAQSWLDEAAEEASIASSNFNLATSLLESAESNLESIESEHLEATKELNAAQDAVDNLCQIKECPQICYPGTVCKSDCSGKTVSCCRFISCKYKGQDTKCKNTNIVCQESIDNANTALEEAIENETELTKELKDAQASTLDFQTDVENTRSILEAAETKLEAAKSSYDAVNSLFSAAEASLEAVTQANNVDYEIADLIEQDGLATLTQAKDCKFTVELTTEDLSVFDVSCQVKAFRLDWQTFVLSIDFNIAQQSIRLAAASTALSFIETFGSTLGRKRRSVDWGESQMMQIPLNKAIDLSRKISCINSADTAINDRILSYARMCHSFKHFIGVLQNAFTALLEKANASESYTDVVHSLTIPFYQSNAATIQNPYKYDIFSNDYFDKKENYDVNMTAYLTDVESNLMEFEDTLGVQRNNSVHISRDFKQECVCLLDCMLHSITHILYLLDGFPQSKVEKESIHEIEEGLDAVLKFSASTPREEMTRVLGNSLEKVKRLNDSNLFCVSPPTIRQHPKNVTVLSGTSVTFACHAEGGPDLLYHWYRNTYIKLEGLTERITLEKITEEDNGSKIHCEVENVVSRVTSLPGVLTVVSYDVNECDTNNGGCQHECQNTIGSYKCVCPGGFTINKTDDHNCEDLDECLQIEDGGCEQKCINYPGSYACNCEEGYILNSDNHTCDDINECAIHNGGCTYSCVNLKGSYECICNKGYTGDGVDGPCHDVDECETENGGCQQICVNTVGTYQCKCDESYTLDDDNLHCIDVNECKVNNGNCEHRCYNSAGSYKCACIKGFTLEADLHKCTSITKKG
ncbi:hypothetical protein ACF0H5_007973 [Mactra antiquata]